MKKIFSITTLLFFLGTSYVFSQGGEAEPVVIKDNLILNSKQPLVKSNDIDPLTPAKAAFYSAILPGLGQAYNKKYWKIPLVYGAIGTSMYFYLDSQKKYNSYRDAYKSRLEGFTDDQYDYLTDTQLITAQKFYQSNRDISALFVVAFYALNIIDANVDAALLQFNVDENLSFKPSLYRDDLTTKSKVGLTLNYNF
ncbi:DUF5683 domain-containing protein [Flavobacterium algicola]|uniref:DUF5683 domain-containing protein n=1 Tax=Flavobacterium algicola TaxID=556529 RepID=UPI001EFCB6A1|nr:DUF5683 domain-containing protein [Flavobacterium algicola]MCG9793062.1 DUF5683 domain-containing protein [Flavobacterium algicola]